MALRSLRELNTGSKFDMWCHDTALQFDLGACFGGTVRAL